MLGGNVETEACSGGQVTRHSGAQHSSTRTGEPRTSTNYLLGRLEVSRARALRLLLLLLLLVLLLLKSNLLLFLKLL